MSGPWQARPGSWLRAPARPGAVRSSGKGRQREAAASRPGSGGGEERGRSPQGGVYLPGGPHGMGHRTCSPVVGWPCPRLGGHGRVPAPRVSAPVPGRFPPRRSGIPRGRVPARDTEPAGCARGVVACPEVRPDFTMVLEGPLMWLPARPPSSGESRCRIFPSAPRRSSWHRTTASGRRPSPRSWLWSRDAEGPPKTTCPPVAGCRPAPTTDPSCRRRPASPGPPRTTCPTPCSGTCPTPTRPWSRTGAVCPGAGSGEPPRAPPSARTGTSGPMTAAVAPVSVRGATATPTSWTPFSSST